LLRLPLETNSGFVEITFLGTGTSQGVPVIACSCAVCVSQDPRDKRLRTSISLRHHGHHLVVDSGPDFRQQLLRENVQSLEAVLFTHEHKDHIAGLDDVRAFNFVQKRTMPVYATPRVHEALKREYQYIFDGTNYPGIPQIEVTHFGDEPFHIGPINVQPIQVYHHKLPVYGFRFDDFVYITDANSIPDKEKDKIKRCKVLVLNALRREQHISHFTLDEAIALVEELQPELTYFTHISHQLGAHADVEQELPPHIRLAYDGLRIRL
jgi:phosphoribosyl 1,2-cyclic phosphate phosphodiesterase